MDELRHHGIKGQKWGVRRYQNKNGTLTAEGRLRNTNRKNIIRNREYTDDVNSIVRSMSDSDKKKLGASLNEDWIEKEYEYDIIRNKAKTFIEKHGDTPVSFVEVWTNGTRTGQIAIGTRSGEEYRGKGYATKGMDACNKWLERYGYLTMDEVEWWARTDNPGSNRLAEKYGFKYQYTEKYDTGEFNYYTKNLVKNPRKDT